MKTNKYYIGRTDQKYTSWSKFKAALTTLLIEDDEEEYVISSCEDLMDVPQKFIDKYELVDLTIGQLELSIIVDRLEKQKSDIKKRYEEEIKKIDNLIEELEEMVIKYEMSQL